jgi:hypothetical protein
MKIRLTEEQYKRLLKEDDKDFLDGMVNFKNIGNKVNNAIAKLFVMMQKEGKLKIDLGYLSLGDPIYGSGFRDIVKYIVLMLDIENSEAILLAHNYISFLRDKIVDAAEKGDPNLLIGEPLQFFGKYKYPINYYWSGYITGISNGNLECYTTDDNDFTKKIVDGIYEVVEDANSNIDYDFGDVAWDPDTDHTYNSIQNDDINYDDITIDI